MHCCLQVLDREQCEELGMGLYLGVSGASDLPPKFIHLTYTPPGARRCTGLSFCQQAGTAPARALYWRKHPSQALCGAEPEHWAALPWNPAGPHVLYSAARRQKDCMLMISPLQLAVASPCMLPGKLAAVEGPVLSPAGSRALPSRRLGIALQWRVSSQACRYPRQGMGEACKDGPDCSWLSSS